LAEGVVSNPRPLVEIRELDQIPGDSASINSGVCTLSNIKKGATIGEYTGEFIHPVAAEDNDDYAFDFWQSTFIGKSGPDAGTERDAWDKTSSVTAQVTGNRLRFVNQSRSSQSANNCMFKQYTISGQMRFVIQARLDIRFGDQLTCHYGMNYFKKENPDKKRKTNKGTKK
jgi:SET domain-containing protein